jgi:hypothetical protein
MNERLRPLLSWVDPKSEGFWNLPLRPEDYGTAAAGGVLLFIGVDRVRKFTSLLSATNIHAHEWGHAVFGLLGWRFLTVLGGTLGQLLLPLGLLVYFLRSAQPKASDFCLFWVGQNCLDIGPYMADARANAMSKVVGILMMPAELVAPGLKGDWYYLLDCFGLLNFDIALGHLVDLTGCVLMTLAAVCAFRRFFPAAAKDV